MEASTLIELLNYSKTLIQNGEIKFLYYKQNFICPDEMGEKHRRTVADLERQLRENPPKSDNPEALRKEILRHIEGQKKYGVFKYSNELFNFVEVNLVYQPQYAYRMEIISRYDKYPSFNAARFYGGGGGQFYRFSNNANKLEGLFPIQFKNGRQIGSLKESELKKSEDAFSILLTIATNLPPPFSPIPVDETRTKVKLTEDSSDMPVYVITNLSDDKETKRKFYVRIKDGLPEIFRRETYYKSYKSDPQLLDAEGYRFSSVMLYRDFEMIEALNISVPKVHEERQFSFLADDEFMNRRIIVIIKEMDFNVELPANFFDWDRSELTSDNDIHEKNLGDVEKEEVQATKK